jgi:glycosyltransferase involved in cell wall biosynthesis
LTHPSVGLCIPALNPDETFFNNLEALSKECKRYDTEIMIVDDGSRKEIKERLEQVSKNLGIKLLIHPSNCGIAKSRNDLVYGSKFDYIIWQDADDISYPSRIKEVQRYIKKYPQSSIFLNWIKYNDNGKISMHKILDKLSFAQNMMFFRNIAQTSAVTVNANMIRKNKLRFEESLTPSEDYAMWLSLIGYGSLIVIPEILSIINVNENGASAKNRNHQERVAFLKLIMMIKSISKNDHSSESLGEFIKLLDKSQRHQKSGNNNLSLKYLQYFTKEIGAGSNSPSLQLVLTALLVEYLYINLSLKNSLIILHTIIRDKKVIYLWIYWYEKIKVSGKYYKSALKNHIRLNNIKLDKKAKHNPDL